MLIIRKEQLQAFEKPLLDAFIEGSISYVLDRWPSRAAEYLNTEDLRGFVTQCIRRGRRLKFRDRGHLTTLLDWECEFGPAFTDKDEWEWLKIILHTDINHASRIFRIENRLKTLRERGEF
jgi:hypothetical protein